MGKNDNAISVKNIKKSFGKLKVLEGVSFEVERGTIVALLGPNGAGKTTMVRILSTLLEADSGTALVEGHDVQKNAIDVRRVIGLTGQYAAVDEYLTGQENLEMMGRLYHLDKKFVKARAKELLEQFELVEAAKRPAKQYSGGMRRRLDLAVSLIASPPIVFLDEPTTGLDPRSRQAMWKIIEQLVKDGTTILLTTQYLEEADQLADKVLVIDGGKVIAEGTVDELKRKAGREKIELAFKTAKDLAAAQTIIKGKNVVVNQDQLTLNTPNSGGVKYVQELLEKLSKQNIKVTELSLHKPTMDDVFLQLTGHTATKDDEDKKEAK